MAEMPNTEFTGWQAYCELEVRDNEAAIEEAKQNAK
jgi:hypothetical protein